MADEYRILSNSNNEPSGNNGSNNMAEIEQQLKELNTTNGKVLEVLSKMSQTNAKGEGPFNAKARQSRGENTWGRSNMGGGFNFRNIGSQSRGAISRMTGEFLDGFEEQVLGTITHAVTTQGRQIANNFAKSVGVEVNQIPKFLGQALADRYLWQGAGAKVKDVLSSKLGKGFNSIIDTFLDGIKDEDVDTQDLFKQIFGRGGATQAAQTAQQAQSTAQAVSKVGDAAQVAGGSLGKFANSSKVGQVAMKGIANVLPKLAAHAGPYAALILAVIAAYKKFQKEVIGPSQELIETVKAMASVTGRYQDSRKKNLEYAQNRIKADIDSVVLKPFSILEDAANNVYNAWDANVRLIAATQGYNKAGVQTLLANYAERLRFEGLGEMIPASDLMSNLSKVLESGLSGKIAEEFAYQATKLGAAVPTQDFFSYAGTYSSVAANAIRQGATQAEAIEEANKSLEEFASNLLYASRELAGGFTTGLQSAESLYEQSVKITQAAQAGSVGQVSGVMTAVSAIIGATAPDLASALTDAVYSAATGGNDSSIVALRSLAGVNASNTEFLRALAQNPKQVFTTIFHNLATMFGATPGAYMEAAEGYAELFGLSAEAFQRVDFEYLAQAINNMDDTNNALSENMGLLVSGQTTLSKEQQVNRQINEYLVNEGLAYVLDNEVAREIQKHMWDEQIAREQMEATYGVEMVGNTLKLFEGIATVVNNILMFLNPLKAIQDTYNLIATLVEGVTLTEDVKRVLLQGRVGPGRSQDYMNLITSNKDLRLIAGLPELMGTSSAYRGVSNFTRAVNTASNPMLALYDAVGNPLNQAAAVQNKMGRGKGSVRGMFDGPGSRYNWGIVSKELATQTFEALANVPQIASTSTAVTQSGKSISARSKKVMDDFLADAGEFINQGKTYEDWVESAKKRGISNLSTALEDYGMSEDDLKTFYTQKAGLAEQEAIREREKQFQESGIAFWTVEFIAFRDELYRRNTEDMGVISQFHADCLTRQDTANELLGEGNILTENRSQTEVLKALKELALTRNDLLRALNITSQINTIVTDLHDIAVIANEFSKYYLHASMMNGDFVKLTNMNWQYMKDKAQHDQNVNLVDLLAQELTKNTADLTTPTAQTNALLASILQVLQAILTQSSNSAGSLSLPDALTALSMGVTQKM